MPAGAHPAVPPSPPPRTSGTGARPSLLDRSQRRLAILSRHVIADFGLTMFARTAGVSEFWPRPLGPEGVGSCPLSDLRKVCPRQLAARILWLPDGDATGREGQK